ncbi:hypothetical protein MTY66_42360 [Mycolicibacterium sp. TY66]|nr:hypothetical protein MTY66_42360 [Mycolicibacterium sp. TY66]BCJ79742.1 hypothetical protein MTY81_11150 [Mycolicibacterium sp. TY81]
MRVEDVMSTVPGPSFPVIDTVPPDTELTSPDSRSLPPGPPGAAGAGLADDGAELAAALEPADGVFDDPQAARDSAANPARVTTP